MYLVTEGTRGEGGGACYTGAEAKTVSSHNNLFCFVHKTGADGYKKCDSRPIAHSQFSLLNFEVGGRGRGGLEERICCIANT